MQLSPPLACVRGAGQGLDSVSLQLVQLAQRADATVPGSSPPTPQPTTVTPLLPGTHLGCMCSPAFLHKDAVATCHTVWGSLTWSGLCVCVCVVVGGGGSPANLEPSSPRFSAACAVGQVEL